MTKLTIIAKVTAKPDHIEFVKAELAQLVAPTLAEEGCIQYDFHQDNENPAFFLFYENWVSRELWQIHMSSAHLTGFVEKTKDALEELVVNEMTLIN